MKQLFIVACLKSVLSISFAVNPACECVLYKGRDHSNQGTFTSPNFPQIYPVNVNCVLYTFIAQLHQIVEITFNELDIQVPATSKCADFVRLFLDLDRPEVNEQNKWNYELCGNDSLSSLPQRRFYSSTSSLILEFHTDHVQTNNTGFKGVYKFIDRVFSTSVAGSKAVRGDSWAQFDVVGGTRRWGTQCTYDFYSQNEPGLRGGTFFSPRYPQNYPPDLRCQYVFYGQRNERVIVRFSTIQLEHIDGSCNSSPDYISVRDGSELSSPVIDRYCNTRTEVEVQSNGQHMVVEMVTDGQKQSHGFAATFAFVPSSPSLSSSSPSSSSSSSTSGKNNDGPPPLATPPTGAKTRDERIYQPDDELNTNNPHDSPVEHVASPYDIDDQTKTYYDGNEQTYRSIDRKNGTFASPGFPNPYRADSTVRYVFQGLPGERVRIVFTDLDLNYNTESGNSLMDPDGCSEEVDYISVSVPLADGPRVIQVICGNKRPPMLMSNDIYLDVTFVSRSASSAKGFRAEYHFVTDFGIKSGVQDRSLPCAFVYRSSDSTNGTFTSPNFPGIYPCNTECHYLFHGRENERVYITFPYFDVDGVQPGCSDSDRSDYVEFSNFNIHLTDRKMNRWCGSKADSSKTWNVNSDGSFFRVTFQSNDVYETSGFQGFYQFRRAEDTVKKRMTPPTHSPIASSRCPKSVEVRSPATLLVATLLMASLLFFDWSLSVTLSRHIASDSCRTWESS